MTYYNPQVGEGEWVEELAVVEADHLEHDMVQDWPVLDATYGEGSLADSGFSIASSLRAESPLPKFIVAMIDAELDPALDNPEARASSLASRARVRAYLARIAAPNVFMVDSLERMLEVSIDLYGVASRILEFSRSYSPAYQNYVRGRDERAAYRQAMASGLLGATAQQIAKDT